MIVSIITFIIVDTQTVKYTNRHEFNKSIDDLCNASINAFSSLIADFKYSKFCSLVRR